MMPGQSAREKKTQIQNTADYEQSFLVVHRAIKKMNEEKFDFSVPLTHRILVDS